MNDVIIEFLPYETPRNHLIHVPVLQMRKMKPTELSAQGHMTNV